MTELARPTDQPTSVAVPTTRDAAAAALVLGLAGAAWGSWGQQDPPAGWSLPLTIGSLLGLVLALAAGLRTYRHRAGDSAMRDPRGRRTYYRTFGVEVVMILVGVFGLSRIGQADYLAAWTLAVVGAHFVPLGRLFRLTELVVAGVLLVGAAIAAVVAGVTGLAAPSAVAGGAGMLVMLVTGVLASRRTVG